MSFWCEMLMMSAAGAAGLEAFLTSLSSSPAPLVLVSRSAGRQSRHPPQPH